MITTPTVLILGAGASMPYDFPSGEKLKTNIISELRHPYSGHTCKMLKNLGFKDSDLDTFGIALRHSGRLSVDAFLEHRPDLIPIGKAAIASELILNEDQNILFPYERKSNQWYNYLYEKMGSSFDDFGRNQLAIITFNYDRSLEHFLVMALEYSFCKTTIECGKILEKIPIIHVHGELGKLLWQDPNGRPYANIVSEGYVKKAADGIKIIHEVDEKLAFAEAHQLIEKASTICFLGFGFAPQNLRRLGFVSPHLQGLPPVLAAQTNNSLNQKRLFASAFGLTASEQATIDGFTGCSIRFYVGDCLDTLRQLGVFG